MTQTLALRPSLVLPLPAGGRHRAPKADPVRIPTTVLAAVLLLLALGTIALLAQPVSPGQAVDTVPAMGVEISRSVPDPEGALIASDHLIAAALGSGVDFTQAQGLQVREAADRVCEGFTAQVPVTTMETTIAQEQGITPGQAHAFVIAAHDTLCPGL